MPGNDVPPDRLFRLVDKPAVVAGHAHGWRYPSLRFALSLPRQGDAHLADLLDGTLSGLMPEHAILAPVQASDRAGLLQSAAHAPSARVLDSLLHWIHALQQGSGLPVFEQPAIVGFLGERNVALIGVPTLRRAFGATATAVRWLVALLDRLAMKKETAGLAEDLEKIFKAFKAASPAGKNVPRFLRAAHEAGIPVSEVAGQTLQFGQGARARWMDSSFTDDTRQISAVIARDKMSAASVLRRAGIPVPPHRMVATEAAALKAAAGLGYPVVVKPARLDGGVGVTAGLMTEEEVRSAFALARKHGKDVLVEKHVDGRDYRLTVFRDELVWAVERVPAGVVGDGVKTVAALVDEINANVRRDKGKYALLKQLKLDTEAMNMLRRAGMDAKSVPARGSFVRLRSIANIGAGGTPVAVFDRVHPDNRQLAVRAAAALRLDMAGVDLLIPDIAVSWKESGAAVCEINAQPQLGGLTSAHLFPQILKALVRGDGRVPIALVLGAPPESALMADMVGRLREAGLAAGWADRTGVGIADERILDGQKSLLAAGQALMMDRKVEAAVMCIDDARVLRTGLPFDRYDVLVLAGSHVALPGGAGRESLMRELLAAVLPGCDGKVVGIESAGLDIEGFESLTPAAWAREPLAPGRAAEAVVAEMLAADARHRGTSPRPY